MSGSWNEGLNRYVNKFGGTRDTIEWDPEARIRYGGGEYDDDGSRLPTFMTQQQNDRHQDDYIRESVPSMDRGPGDRGIDDQMWYDPQMAIRDRDYYVPDWAGGRGAHQPIKYQPGARQSSNVEDRRQEGQDAPADGISDDERAWLEDGYATYGEGWDPGYEDEYPGPGNWTPSAKRGGSDRLEQYRRK
jgi:hypothetical protein